MKKIVYLIIVMKFCAKILLYIYKFFISPLLPKSCRFIPSCSSYALEAIKKYGLLIGGILTFKRIISCNPFSKKDLIDEVPGDIKDITPFCWIRKFTKKS